MKLFFNIVLYGLIGLIAFGAVLGGLAYYCMSHEPSSPHIVQTSAPTAREEAIKRCPIFLPQSARGIQYASISSSYRGAVFVRFDATVSDCYASAKSLFEQYAYDKAHRFPTFQPTSHPQSIKGRTPFCPDWFDLDRESEWIVAGMGVSGEPKIWIDKSSGTFFMFLPRGLD